MKGVLFIAVAGSSSWAQETFIPLATEISQNSNLPELTFDLGDTLYDRLVKNGNSNDGNSLSLYK